MPSTGSNGKGRNWVRPRFTSNLHRRLSSRYPGALVILIAFLVSLIPPGLFLPAPRGMNGNPEVLVKPQPAQVDERFFPETGFAIIDDPFFNYFKARGGLKTFGYPTSNKFLLLGTQVQFFQRRIMQIQPDGSVGLLNVMDPELMPFNTMNGATYPAYDPSVTAAAPKVGSPGYDKAILDFVRQNAPETFEGLPVRFFSTFLNTVTFNDAFPSGRGDPSLLPGFDLEMWGVPTSKPARDPNNSNFIYLRFQRGVMQYDATTGLTQGVLIADFLKSIITGENLPPDLEAQARGSRFYRQYNNSMPNGLNRPAELPGTDMRNAFARDIMVPVPPLTGINDLRYGMQAYMFAQPQNRLIDLTYTAGFRWLKQQIRWSEFEPSPGQIKYAPLDELVSNASARDAALMFSIVTSPTWARADGKTTGPPDDFNNFGNFVFALASRYKGKVVAYEIWNEQNMAREWVGRQLSPGDYVELLKIAYTRIKQADPNAIVVSGALTPTGVNDGIIAIDDVAYLRGMYAYQNGVIRAYMDALGAHATGYNNAPQDFVDLHTVNTPGYKNHPSFYFRRIDQLREVMVQNGDANRKMWLTEYHWGSATLPVPAGYEWTTHLSEQQVATFFAQGIQMIQADRPWVGAVFVWNLNYRTIEDFHTNEQALFGIINPNFSPRLIYTALRQVAK